MNSLPNRSNREGERGRLKRALNPLPRLSGFTLIEIMIAIAILGVVAALAVPAYNGYVRQSRVGSLLHNWETAVSTVRTEAAYSGGCRDVVAMLNSGDRKGIGNGAVSAFSTSGSDAGTVVIQGLGSNNCPEDGESVTITAFPAAGTAPGDYPGGAAPSVTFTINN